MPRKILSTIGIAIALLVGLSPSGRADDEFDRTSPPIQAPKRPTYKELDVRNAKAPKPWAVRAPKEAPNVVIVLIDDVGFGATSTFGGPIRTPTLDKLAAAGLRFNNFNTTALCSPSCLRSLQQDGGCPPRPSGSYLQKERYAPLHRAPWQTGKQTPLLDDAWDLYCVTEDFSLVNNLAERHPEKLKTLRALFMSEAEKYHALPIVDRTIERTNPALAGRPDFLAGRTSLTLYDGMTGMLENTFLNVKNLSKTITAEVVIPKSGGKGVILCQGGRFGGWCLYMKDGKPAYTYNWLGLECFSVASDVVIAPGQATIVLDFVYDGGGMGKGGKATLSVNGKVVAEGRVGKTQPFIFSADETADVGLDNQTPVAEGIGVGPVQTRFSGTIHKVVLAVKEVK